MVIEVVIFFIWIFFVLVVGAVVTIRSRRRRKMQGIENINARLSFPQRNWLPLCVVVAIVSPLVVNAVKSVTRKKPETVSVRQNGTNYTGGDSTIKDTSYHVATPPSNATPGNATPGSATPASAPTTK